MKAHWKDINGQSHAVKNLGWLLRHAANESTDIHIEKLPEGKARLQVDLTLGRTFHCCFADHSVLLAFIKRPSLRHCTVHHV